MKSDLTSVPAGFYRACYEHLDAGAAWYRVPSRLLSVPLAVTFLAEFTSLTSFFLLLSVMPMLAAAGAGSSGAGMITGSLLLGTVAAEAVAAAAIRQFGYRMVLAAGAMLLGAPALAILAREPQTVMVSVSLVRGLEWRLPY
jgi:hypothetical protein